MLDFLTDMQNDWNSIKWGDFNGTNTNSVIDFYNSYIYDIYRAISKVKPDDTVLTASVANSLNYRHWFETTRWPGYWFHYEIPAINDNRAKLLFKVASLGRLPKDKCEEHGITYVDRIIGEALGKCIYTVDKFDPYKNEHSDKKITALSNFIPYIEQTKKGSKQIRFMGSTDGKSKIRAENLIYEQTLFHGPKSNTEPLICPVRGISLLPYTRTNFSTNKKMFVSDGQWHHILYTTAKGSIFKTIEPSKLLTERLFKSFSHEQHLEMMGCIPICGDEHDAIHAANNIDGINHWFKRLEINECKLLPYHFYTEEQYNETVLWMADNTYFFDLTRTPDYNSFVNMLSTSILQTHSNISLQDFCSLPLSKNHPIQQRSIPYTEWIEKRKIQDFLEILPKIPSEIS